MAGWNYRPARDIGMAPGERLHSVVREPGLVSVGLHAAWRGLTRGYLRAFHGLKAEGLENLPAEPPFVMIANHASHVDALLMAAILPGSLARRTYPLAADDVLFNKPHRTAFSTYLVNALPMRRRRPRPGDLAALRARLVEEPCAFILFPEGARSRDGALMPFKGGLGRIVAGTGVPVVPCWLDGAFEALPPMRFWPRLVPISIRIGQPLGFAALADDRQGWEEIARTAEAAVRALMPRADPSGKGKPDPA
jgi:1-acyl-sn-glycerol-3-phosphate acyltransferase